MLTYQRMRTPGFPGECIGLARRGWSQPDVATPPATQAVVGAPPGTPPCPASSRSGWDEKCPSGSRTQGGFARHNSMPVPRHFRSVLIAIGATFTLALAVASFTRPDAPRPLLRRGLIPAIPRVVLAGPQNLAGEEALPPAAPCASGPTIDALLRSWCPAWPAETRPGTRAGTAAPGPRPSAPSECAGRDCVGL